MSGRVLALVESNTSGTGRLFVRRARESGLRPVLLTADASRYRWGDDEPEVVAARTDDLDDVVRACAGLAGDLAGVGTSSEYYVSVAAAAARRFGRPGADPAAVEATRDKERQCKRLHAGGVAVPPFAGVSDVDDAIVAAERLGPRIVVKPLSGSGSRGVRLCGTAEEAVRYAGKLLGERVDERGRPVPRRVLLQEYVPGEEFSVELFGSVAVGVTRKHLGAPPYFVETGHDFPATLPPAGEQALRDTARRAVSRLGLAFGPAHVELRLGPAGPVVIEVNPRLAGGWIPRLVHEATGVDLVLETVRGFAGLPPSRSPHVTPGRCSIRFLIPGAEGELVAVHGVEEAAAVPGVIEVQVYREPGALLRSTGDFRDRIGHVVARSGAAAETALGRLVPQIRGGP